MRPKWPSWLQSCLLVSYMPLARIVQTRASAAPSLVPSVGRRVRTPPVAAKRRRRSAPTRDLERESLPVGERTSLAQSPCRNRSAAAICGKSTIPQSDGAADASVQTPIALPRSEGSPNFGLRPWKII